MRIMEILNDSVALSQSVVNLWDWRSENHLGTCFDLQVFTSRFSITKVGDARNQIEQAGIS